MSKFTVQDFNKALEEGPYVWPGGYPRYFVMSDGEALSFEAATQEADQIREATSDPCDNSGWRVVGVDVNWEDPDLYCSHTGNHIPSTYGDDE